jgi:hypothetical protein
MNKLLTLIFISVMLASCAPKVYTLKGAYPAPPIVYNSEKNFETVWSNVIDLFAQKGIPIQLVDKSSGLIVSGSATLTWSFEDKIGNLVKTDAWVVLPKMIDKGNNKLIKPYAVYGSWNIRIKTDGSKTSINTNLYNISAVYSNPAAYTKPAMAISDGRSTGNFEKFIYDLVK